MQQIYLPKVFYQFSRLNRNPSSKPGGRAYVSFDA